MKTLSRREFVKSVGAASALAAVRPMRAVAASDKIIVGVMGVGGRGAALAGLFAARRDVEIAYLCDADTRRAASVQKLLERTKGRTARFVQDFRRILDDPEVDVLVNATPDHWHALGTILACKAGKHVYVEKPMAHGVWEGRKMVEAARKHGRVVTVGMQSRSAPYVAKAREIIQSGRLGRIHLVRVCNLMQHPRRTMDAQIEPPAEVNYDLWCGPAPLLPYAVSRAWLNHSEFSCGPIPGDAVHQLDLARYLLGDPPPPGTVSHTGGILSLNDGRDTPDTQIAMYEYDTFTLLFEGALWTPYMKKIPQQIRDNDLFPDWRFCATRIELLGTDAFMCVGRHGGGWQVFDENHRIVEQSFGRPGDIPHIDNFLECVRSGGRPNADVEQGHQSVLLCHLANISWRVGNRKLSFDPVTESFPDTPEANAFLRRASYRDPWTVPDPI